MLAFNECLRTDELAVAMQIWSNNKDLMRTRIDEVIESLVVAIEHNPSLLVMKMYFLK